MPGIIIRTFLSTKNTTNGGLSNQPSVAGIPKEKQKTTTTKVQTKSKTMRNKKCIKMTITSKKSNLKNTSRNPSQEIKKIYS